MFYLSSRGSSATVWLSSVLSKHPDIVCFHPSRSIPPIDNDKTYPYHEWVKEMSPTKYIESLCIFEKSLNYVKRFGSTHGYMGIDAKIPCEKMGGYFSYITRHPLERIHSCFIYNMLNHYYLEHNIDVKNSEVFDRIIGMYGQDEELEISLKDSSQRRNIFPKALKNKIYKNLKTNY